MKKTLIPIVVIHYLSLIVGILLFTLKGDISSILAWVLLFLTIIGFLLIILNILNTVLHRNDNNENNIKLVMIVKLLLIPYYIGSFLLGVIFVLVGLLSLVTIFWLASFGLGFVAFMMLVYNYLLTLSTSSLNIARMIKTYDEYPLIIAAIITIAHFIMVFDVFSAIYLYLYHKNKKNNVINIKQEFKEELPN